MLCAGLLIIATRFGFCPPHAREGSISDDDGDESGRGVARVDTEMGVL